YRLPPYLRYPSAYGPPAAYGYNYYPLYESYSGYYAYPYSLYNPPFQRRSGLVGRFYGYPELPFRAFQDGDRRDDDSRRNGEEGEQ
ncbi:hypothetical protein ACFL55_02300, partial [Candidatus Latescibacterota bacterium]